MTVEQIDEVVMVGGSSRIPMVRNAVEVLFRARPHTDLNPDEVVALGAAVQAGILGGSVEDQLAARRHAAFARHRNHGRPGLQDHPPQLDHSGQRERNIHHLRSTASATCASTSCRASANSVKDCRSLLVFDLKDIDPLPAGLARIEVRFLIDANGILNVTARDARTGKEQSMDVKPTYGLTDEQVEAMIEASFDQRGGRFRARQVAEARVEADTILAGHAKGQDQCGVGATERRRTRRR